MADCTFPNDTKITTMAPLRSENILITCKNNVYKTNRQSLFHKKRLSGVFIDFIFLSNQFFFTFQGGHSRDFRIIWENAV